MLEQKKRETAYKIRIGDLLRSNQVFDQTPIDPESQRTRQRLLHVELGNKKLVRVNIIANIIDKFESDRETRFASLTLDDGSGQIKARVFGEDIRKFRDFVQGDTVLIIGLLRSFNQELYVLPELIKKQDPKYLLVRKLEIEKLIPKPLSTEQKKEMRALRDEIIESVKNAEHYEGIDKDMIILHFKDVRADLIEQEIKKLLEDGILYEPRPGRIRYLG
ncbi:hypothetical protein J4221_06170 [Candidatus Pacearchaeota archaeon]|nr:hypothetical protein [Candidatus Pacearchaeota archaeon]